MNGGEVLPAEAMPDDECGGWCGYRIHFCDNSTQGRRQFGFALLFPPINQPCCLYPLPYTFRATCICFIAAAYQVSSFAQRYPSTVKSAILVLGSMDTRLYIYPLVQARNEHVVSLEIICVYGLALAETPLLPPVLSPLLPGPHTHTHVVDFWL